MWAMDWRVARLCAWETYFDTPYYEQLQYVGDTPDPGAHLALHVGRRPTGAAGHRALRRLADPGGNHGQPLPVGPRAVHPDVLPDLGRDGARLLDAPGRPAYVRELLPGVRRVLDWYERHVDATGLLGPMPWWNYVDWAPDGRRAFHPARRKGTRPRSPCIRVRPPTCGRARGIARPVPAKAPLPRARRVIRAAVRAKAWDAARGLFRDSPEAQRVSQQTNSSPCWWTPCRLPSSAR